VNGKEYWIAYQNFYAITRYNISKHYAMAVYQLSEAIAGRENPLAVNAAAGQPGA
jgi:membrane-bound lytic murein transglycosylase B